MEFVQNEQFCLLGGGGIYILTKNYIDIYLLLL